jgi:hypothetical protein
MTNGSRANHRAAPTGACNQAALASSFCTLSAATPLIAIRRGFMASGISRTSSSLEQAVVKRGALDLHIIRKVELALEVARRDAAVTGIPLGLVGLLPSIVTTFCSAVIAMSCGAKPATASEICSGPR